MLSLILTSALFAQGDMPTAAAPGRRAGCTTCQQGQPSSSFYYYNPSDMFGGGIDYSVSGFRGGCGGCCPTDDVNLFFPCGPAAPCAPFAPCPPGPPRSICPPRINTYPCPTPIRNCPCPPPLLPAPPAPCF